MTTTVVITGTGVPQVDPTCAGAGVLVRTENHHLQFDAGRATAMRLAEVGVRPPMLDALFVTHHHSDHLLGVTDLVISRWIEGRINPAPLPIVAPSGPIEAFVEHLMQPWQADLELRAGHLERNDRANPVLSTFEATHDNDTEVWSDGDVRVLARRVHHEPVDPAVAYRVETPDGVVVISGDTIVCDEVAEFCAGADVVVHEAFRKDLVLEFAAHLPHLRHVAEYHADTKQLGAMAAEVGIPTLVLTHLIPALSASPDMEAGFVDDLRSAGYQGELVIARDLTTVELPRRTSATTTPQGAAT